MTRRIKFVLLSAVGLAAFGFAVLQLWPKVVIATLVSGMMNQARLGQEYMMSLSPQEIQKWIERSDEFIANRDPNRPRSLSPVAIPEELKRLKILRIDVSKDHVEYVWLGGMDSTSLVVRRFEDGSHQVIAQLSTHYSEVIWPKP
jgi:hypothetical protein